MVGDGPGPAAIVAQTVILGFGDGLYPAAHLVHRHQLLRGQHLAQGIDLAVEPGQAVGFRVHRLAHEFRGAAQVVVCPLGFVVHGVEISALWGGCNRGSDRLVAKPEHAGFQAPVRRTPMAMARALLHPSRQPSGQPPGYPLPFLQPLLPEMLPGRLPLALRHGRPAALGQEPIEVGMHLRLLNFGR